MTAAALRSAGGRPARFDRRLLVPMMLGSILNPINSSIIAVALVPIAAAFGAPASQTAWLVSGLYIATAIGQPLTGRFVDQFGPRRVFFVGAALTALAGVIGVLAPSIAVLVVARVVLGFGTCAGYPASIALIRREGERTGDANPAGVLTALAVAVQTIAVVGPTLGGLLIGLGGWRATFAVDVPLGVLTLVLGAWILPREARGATRSHPRIDWPGIALFATLLVTLLVFLLEPRLDRLWLVAAGLAAAVLFARRELAVADPFIDLRVFGGNLPLLATYARSLLSATVSYAWLYGFSQWLEDGRGLDPTAAGLVLLPTFAVGIAVSALTGRRPEVKGKLLVGAATQLVVCIALLAVTGGSPVWLLAAVAALLGVPQGLNNLANQNAMYAQADPARSGASAGLLRTFFYLGAIAASTATGLSFGRRADDAGLHALAVVALAAAALFVVLTVADRSLARVGVPRTPPAGTR